MTTTQDVQVAHSFMVPRTARRGWFSTAAGMFRGRRAAPVPDEIVAPEGLA